MNIPFGQFFAKWKTNAGADRANHIDMPPFGRMLFDNNGNPKGVSQHECSTFFNLLTSTSVSATTDPWFVNSGTGTEVIARATKGGQNIKSQSTTPADGDNVLLAPGATTTGMYVPIAARCQPRLETRIAINTITFMFMSIGFNENITDADPTGTAGEGAMLFFDPTGEFASSMANYTTNFGIAHKVNGADTFTDTGIPVIAGQDYEFVVQIGEDLKSRSYINGALVATGPTLTDADIVAAFAGLELTATPGEQKDMDIRYIRVTRLIG
jgi:hypothetical protein